MCNNTTAGKNEQENNNSLYLQWFSYCTIIEFTCIYFAQLSLQLSAFILLNHIIYFSQSLNLLVFILLNHCIYLHLFCSISFIFLNHWIYLHLFCSIISFIFLNHCIYYSQSLHLLFSIIAFTCIYFTQSLHLLPFERNHTLHKFIILNILTFFHSIQALS